MTAKTRPLVSWIRWSFLLVLLCLLALTTVVRLRMYFMTRKIQAVVHGLAELHIDQTTEEQMHKTVPYLTRSKWGRGYYVEITNETDYSNNFLFRHGLLFVMFMERTPGMPQVLYWLGFRYISFDAGVLIKDGRVTQVSYGLSREWVRPKVAGYIVSARSVHGLWVPRNEGLEVSSLDDQSPQYRVTSDRFGVRATYTNDAPSELTKRAFELNLECFWDLQGCEDLTRVAPTLWEDSQTLKDATLQRLRVGQCPESIVEGRMKYLPDVSVFLLGVAGSRRVNVNEEGYQSEDSYTDYKLKEVIRGTDPGRWQNMRYSSMIPSPLDPTQRITNETWPRTKVGDQVVFFGNMNFESCRMIRATPSILEMLHKIPVPDKRPEDEIQRGLL